MGNDLVCLKNKCKKDLLEIDAILNNDLYSDILDYIGEGLFSTVYGFDDLAVKRFKDDKYLSEKEDYIYLKELTKSKYYPTLIGYKEKNIW